MINKESKTLRELSLKTTTKKGDKIIIKYGYDMSGRHSGYYVTASINGKAFSDKPSILKKVRSLGITAINDLIDAIGTDVTGTPEKFETRATELIEAYTTTESDKDWKALMNFYRINSEDIDAESQLAGFIEKYFEASPRTQTTLLRRFNKSRRVAFIEQAKRVIKGLYVLYNDSQSTVKPKFEGYMNKRYYADWYKRDIDYIRKARVKLFRDVLKRKYVASAR